MTIYIASILALPALGYYMSKDSRDLKKSFFYLAICGAALTAIASCRYGIGYDYFSYKNMYDDIKDLDWISIFYYDPWEFFFSYYTKFLSFLGLSYTGYLAATSLLLHSAALWFIFRLSKLPWLSIYLYLTLQFFAYNMNLLRQAISVSFFLLAFPFFLNRKFAPYVLLMVLGGFFHTSAFVILILSFILLIPNTIKFMSAIGFIFIILYWLLDPAILFITTHLLKGYSGYLNTPFWQGNSFSYTVFPTLYFLLVLSKRKNLLIADKAKFGILINSSLVSCVLSFFITRHFILERFSIYFFSLSLILLPELVLSLPESHDKVRYIKSYVFLVLLFGAGYFLFAVQEGFHNVYPYYSLLDRAGA